MHPVCDMIVVCFTFDTSVPAVLGWATFGLGHPYLAADRFHNSPFFPVAQGKSLVVFYTVSRDMSSVSLSG